MFKQRYQIAGGLNPFEYRAREIPVSSRKATRMCCLNPFEYRAREIQNSLEGMRVVES